MAETALPTTAGTSRNPTAAVTLTMTAADVANGQKFALTGRELLILHNSGASTRTYTVTSVADPYGRLGHITTQNILAGAYMAIGPLDVQAWRQTDGQLYISVSNAEVLLGVYVLA